jgi:hypothetical protein
MLRLFGSGVALLVAIVAAALFFPPRDRQPAPADRTAQGGQSTVAVPTLGPGQVALEFDEAQLTRLAAAGVSGMAIDAGPLGSATVRDFAVRLQGGQILASGTAQIGPTPLPLTLGGTLQAVNGRPRLALSDARLSGVQMPQAARAAIEQTLQSQVDQLTAGQPLRVSSVTVDNGKLTIIGSRA